MATLVLLNGPPGVGKSTLARRLASDRSGAVVVDVDELRASVAQAAAIERGQAMVVSHLAAGHDVVLPQFSVRASFFAWLDDVVHRTDATLDEVVLVAEPDVVLARFLARRASRLAANGIDVSDDIPTSGAAEVIAWAIQELATVAGSRPLARLVRADGDLEATYVDVNGRGVA